MGKKTLKKKAADLKAGTAAMDHAHALIDILKAHQGDGKQLLKEGQGILLIVVEDGKTSGGCLAHATKEQYAHIVAGTMKVVDLVVENVTKNTCTCGKC